MGAFAHLPDSDLVKMFNSLAGQVFYCSLTKGLSQQRQKGFWEPDYKHISLETKPQACCTEYEYISPTAPTQYTVYSTSAASVLHTNAIRNPYFCLGL